MKTCLDGAMGTENGADKKRLKTFMVRTEFPVGKIGEERTAETILKR